MGKRRKKRKRRPTRWKGLVNWLESVFRFFLVPNRRHRMRYFLLIFGLMCMMILLNRGQHPMSLSHNIHSPTYQNSAHGFLFSGLFSQDSSNHKVVRRPLIQDWVFAPNCDALLRGDEEEIHFTKRMLYREVRDKVTDTEYYDMTKSCADFRATEGYSPVALSVEESNFPIAYIIQSYKNAEQLSRLLRAIYAPQNPYCICSNHKATQDFDRSVNLISNCFRNVFHASTLKFNKTNNQATEVDDINCARKCMKVLLNLDWKYVIKIHSQDYPLVTSQYITAKLKNLERLKIPFISDYSHMHRKQSAKIAMMNSTVNGTETAETTDITLWRGSPYFIASHSIIEQIMDNILTYKLLPTIQHHEHPEAYYWVTLFLHVMGDANHAAIVAANMHRIELLTHKKLHTKQYCAGVTQLMDHCILGVEDLGKLFHAHQHQFFAHGFDLDHDHVAYNCLEQRIADAVADYSGNLTLTFNNRKIHATQPEIEIITTDKSSESLDKIADGQVEQEQELLNVLEKVKEKSSNVIHNVTDIKNSSTMDDNKIVSSKNHTSKIKKVMKPDEEVINSKKIQKLAVILIDEISKDYVTKEHSKNDTMSNKVKTKDEQVQEINKKLEVENRPIDGNDTTLSDEKKTQKHIKVIEASSKPEEVSHYDLHANSEKKAKQTKPSNITADNSKKLFTEDVHQVPKDTKVVDHNIAEDEMYADFEPVTQSDDALVTSAPTEEIKDLLKSINEAKHKHEHVKLEVDMLGGNVYDNDYVENMDLGEMDELKSDIKMDVEAEGDIQEAKDQQQATEVDNPKVHSLDKKQTKDESLSVYSIELDDNKIDTAR